MLNVSCPIKMHSGELLLLPKAVLVHHLATRKLAFIKGVHALQLNALTCPPTPTLHQACDMHFKTSVQVLQHFHLGHTVLKDLSQDFLFQSCSFSLWLQWWSCDSRRCRSSQTWHESQSEMCFTGKKSWRFSSFLWHLRVTKEQHTPALNPSLVFQAIIWTKNNIPQPLPPCIHLQKFSEIGF